jgi:hypothetical protein
MLCVGAVAGEPGFVASVLWVRPKPIPPASAGQSFSARSLQLFAMPDFLMSRSLDLNHHVIQGGAWLDASESGAHSVPLSYAAFELRLAIERLAMQYLFDLRGWPSNDERLDSLRTYKSMEKIVYSLAGNQREINGHFEFMRIVYACVKLETPLTTPDLGKLSRYWHTCSEFCHIGGMLALHDESVLKLLHAELLEIAAAVSDLVSGLTGWPTIKDGEFLNLRGEFIAGRADASDVEAYLRRIGIWARIEYTDGRPAQFAGEPIPPDSTGAA